MRQHDITESKLSFTFAERFKPIAQEQMKLPISKLQILKNYDKVWRKNLVFSWDIKFALLLFKPWDGCKTFEIRKICLWTRYGENTVICGLRDKSRK